MLPVSITLHLENKPPFLCAMQLPIGATVHDALTRLKKQIAVAHPSLFEDEKQETRVSGHHVGEGVPRQFIITSEEIYEAISGVLTSIVQAVRVGLENTPPELSADISERGISLCGGGALIRGLDLMIQDKTGVPVHVAEDPLTCVARGCGASLAYLDNQSSLGVFS